MPRQFRGFLVLSASLAVLLLLLGGPPVRAQGGTTGRSAEQQKKYEELMRSAKQHQSMGELAIKIGAGFIALGLLYAAYSTFRHGLKITETRRVEGTTASVIAGLLILLAVGIVAAGFLYVPSLLP
jgi:hypothetical protein